MTRFLIRLASWVVPNVRRREWRERWEAELRALESEVPGTVGHAGLRFAVGAFPDAAIEAAHGLREGWSLAGLAADVRDAWRSSVRSPGSTCLTILIVGIGTTAAASIFSLADAVLLRPPPAVSSPEELVQIGRHDTPSFDNFSYPNFRDLQDALQGTVELAGYARTSVVIGSGLDAEVVSAQGVTANYLRVLGVDVSNGPGFTPTDEVRYRDLQEVVVSQSFWRDHQDPIAAANGYVTVNGLAFRVVGVAPRGFSGIDVGSTRPALWAPLGVVRRAADEVDRFAERGHSWLWVFGRTASGLSLTAARSAVVAAHARLAETHAATIGSTMTFTSGVGLRPNDREEGVTVLAMFSAVAVLVLVIAVANVTTVQFARALRRRAELVLRSSMGASRVRVLRGLVVEQLLLAALGAATAYGLTFWSTAWLRSKLPYDLAVTFGPDLRVLSFSLAVAVIASFIVSIWPLWSATRTSPAEILKVAEARQTNRRVGTVLMATQLALSAFLLGTAGLFLRSTVAAATAEPGFAADHVLVVTVRRTPGDDSDAAELFGRLTLRLRAVPGVTDVGVTDTLPVVEPQSRQSVRLPDAVSDPAERPMNAVVAHVDAGFFQVLQMPVVAGRALSLADVSSGEGVTPVVITASLAGRLWPDAEPLGQAFGSVSRTMRVVGVTAPVAVQSIRDTDMPAMWLPVAGSAQVPSHLVLRTSGDPSAMAGPVRSALEPFGREVMIRRIDALAPRVATSLSDTMLAAEVTTTLGLIAVAMAGVGLYGVVSSQVVRRRREFGVQMALGASPPRIVRGVLRQSLLTALCGAVAGAAALWLLAPQLQPLLYRVRPSDPLVLVVTVIGPVAVALVASLAPALRASRTDPLTVMRAD